MHYLASDKYLVRLDYDLQAFHIYHFTDQEKCLATLCYDRELRTLLRMLKNDFLLVYVYGTATLFVYNIITKKQYTYTLPSPSMNASIIFEEEQNIIFYSGYDDTKNVYFIQKIYLDALNCQAYLLWQFDLNKPPHQNYIYNVIDNVIITLNTGFYSMLVLNAQNGKLIHQFQDFLPAYGLFNRYRHPTTIYHCNPQKQEFFMKAYYDKENEMDLTVILSLRFSRDYSSVINTEIIYTFSRRFHEIDFSSTEASQYFLIDKCIYRKYSEFVPIYTHYERWMAELTLPSGRYIYIKNSAIDDQFIYIDLYDNTLKPLRCLFNYFLFYYQEELCRDIYQRIYNDFCLA